MEGRGCERTLGREAEPIIQGLISQVQNLYPKNIEKPSEGCNQVSDVIRARGEQEWTPLSTISVARRQVVAAHTRSSSGDRNGR